jgi:Gpi18-like mannosyltransferase
MNWYAAIKQNGMAGVLAPQLQWTYSPLHLYLWALAAWCFPLADNMLMLKAVSLVMEIGLIAMSCLLVWHTLPTERRLTGLFTAFTLLWLNPVLILNVAAWGQTDASYAALSVLSLWLLLKDRPAWAMVCFGLALAFKLQAIFLLPALVIAYFCREKKFSLLWFLLIPAVWVATGVPMALLGQSPLYAVTVYLGQTGMYTQPTFNCPNFFALLGDALTGKQMTQGLWQRLGLVLAIGSLGGAAVWLIIARKALSERAILLLGAWCVLVCLFFLPRMHERYGMVGDVLLLLWAVAVNRPRGYAWVLLGLAPTLSAYCQYLYANPIISLQLGGALNLALLMILTWELTREVDACPALAPNSVAVA